MKRTPNGFSVVELILAAALLLIFAIGSVTVVLQGIDTNRLGEEQTIANQFAAEGIEAVRSIKNQAYANLATSAATGVTRTSNVWAFSGTNNQFGPSNKYTRTLSIADVQRNVGGNIVVSGGTVDPDTKKVSATVTWNVTPTRPNSVDLSTYLTNWRANYPTTNKGGMLVYADGGTTLDTISYKLLDTSQNWSASATAADVDGLTTNKAARAIRAYASSSRNEKIILSRHYNGTAQFIYGQVYNGTTWGNVQQLSTWTAATFLDVQNFDGTYLANGNFMVVYSDNTVIPKMRIWNGTTWSAQTSLTTLAGANIPSTIVTKARAGTNEVMAAFYTTSTATITQYYNGTVWSAITSHSAAAPLNTKKIMDFDWSPNNPLLGEIVYAASATDRKVNGKIWTANGLGGGAWSVAAAGTLQGVAANRTGALSVIGRPGVSQFLSCSAFTAPNIVCFLSSVVPAWTNPTNQIVAATTNNGIQRTFGMGFEKLSGDPAVVLYSDNTTVPKVKKFTASTSTFDLTPTAVATIGGIVQAARVIPNPINNDMMMFFSDANLDLFSQGWDGTNNNIYNTAAGSANLEASLDTNANGTAESFITTANATQTVDKINVYLDATSTVTNLTAGIYTNNAGHPGTLLGQGTISTLVNGGWNTVPISSASITSGTTYWITVLGTGTGTIRFRDRAVGICVSETSAQTTLSSLPATWTTGSTFTTCPLSAYAPISGLSFWGHAINGPAITHYWYDFTWDNF